MIEVGVRDEHEIQIWQGRARKRTAHEPQRTESAEPQVHADAAEQDRISKNPNAVEIDENRCVPEPCERDGVIAPRRRMRRLWRRCNLLPNLGEALPEDARAPCRRAAESGDSGVFLHGF
jgi:hypothetical protein